MGNLETPRQVLEEVERRVSKRRHWLGNGGAMKIGFFGVRRCLWATLQQVSGLQECDENASRRADNLLESAAHRHYRLGYIAVNDTIGHSASMELLDHAIKKAKAQEDSIAHLDFSADAEKKEVTKV